MTPPQLVCFIGVLEPLERIVADRLEHPESLLAAADEALLEQRLQRVELGVADLLGCRERAPTGEDREAAKESPLLA